MIYSGTDHFALCPFERIARCINTIGTEYDSIRITFGSYGVRTITPNKKGWNGALGFSESDRLSFRALPKAIVKAEFITQGDVYAVRDIKVLHELETDIGLDDGFKYGGEIRYNGENGGKKVCYREALIMHPNTAKRFTPFVEDEDVPIAEARRCFCDWVGPFWDGSQYLIYGPTPERSKRAIGKFDTGVGVVNLYGNTETFSRALKVPPKVETISTGDETAIGVGIIFDFGDKKLMFDINQGRFEWQNRSISYNSLLQIYKTICYIEMHSNTAAAVFHMKQYHASYIPVEITTSSGSYPFDDYYYGNVETDLNIREIFARFDARSDGIYVRTPSGEYGRIFGDGSKACHVICLTYLFSSIADDTFTAFFKTLGLFIDQGMVKLGKENGVPIFIGNSRSVVGKSIRVGTLEGTLALRNIVRIDSKRVPADFENIRWFGMLGCDPFPGNNVPGKPDHYILVDGHGKHLECVFDPYKNYDYIERGADVTSMLDQGDAVLVLFGFTVDDNYQEVVDAMRDKFKDRLDEEAFGDLTEALRTSPFVDPAVCSEQALKIEDDDGTTVYLGRDVAKALTKDLGVDIDAAIEEQNRADDDDDAMEPVESSDAKPLDDSIKVRADEPLAPPSANEVISVGNTPVIQSPVSSDAVEDSSELHVGNKEEE